LTEGITIGHLQAMENALKSKNIVMVWLLILLETDEPFIFDDTMPMVVGTHHLPLIKLALNQMGNFPLTHVTQMAYLIEAIKSCSIDLINEIWEALKIPNLLSTPRLSVVQDWVKRTRNRQIIQKFLK
jgi:hypothetical protein